MEIHVRDDPDAVARSASARIGDLISGAGERFTLGLAGGSTPLATYRRLREPAIGWEKVDVWLSDERWVPHDHERCNGRMADEVLLSHVDAGFHRPPYSDSLEAADAASVYETEIRSIHGDRRPDLIMLGMGADGHTASLFPGNPALEEAERWYVATYVPEMGEDRLTATYPLLWLARLIVVVTVGLGKAPAVRASIDGSTPAGRLGEGDGAVEWYVDKDAASLLD